MLVADLVHVAVVEVDAVGLHPLGVDRGRDVEAGEMARLGPLDVFAELQDPRHLMARMLPLEAPSGGTHNRKEEGRR